MFEPKPPVEKTGLENAIDKVEAEMTSTTADSEDFAKMVKQLTKLYKIKDAERPSRVSKDTLAIIGGNVLVALMIIGHERGHVIGAQAAKFLRPGQSNN